MSKLAVLIFIIFLAGLAVFAIFNQNVTTVQIPFGQLYETPTIALILLSGTVGAFFMLLLFIIRDTKHYVDRWQYQKRQKKQAKVQELYSKALNNLLAHHNQAEAKNLLNQILLEDSNNLNALLQLGDIAANEEDFRSAREYYQKAKDIYPHKLEPLFSLAALMEKTDKFSEALRYTEEILDIDEKNLSALSTKRNILEKLGRWDEVVSVQKTIMKYEHSEKDKQREKEKLIGYKYEYGRDSLENGDLEKAKKAFRTVLRLEKNFIPATLGLAEVLLREGETEEAINLLEKTYEQTSSLILLLRLEDLLISVGEPLRLIRIYKGKISRHPQDFTLKFFLGRLYSRLEMIDDAFETLTSIEPGASQNPEMHQLLGKLYLKRNQVDKAAHEYRKALDFSRCAFTISYVCDKCGHLTPEWSGRCPDCHRWSTYQIRATP